MSDLMQIPDGDYGLVRLFAIEAEDADDWDTARLSAEMQADLLPLGVEIIGLRDLSGLGLATYLVDGQGVDEATLDEDRRVLDALVGHVAILRSTAFGGQAQELTIAPPLRWIGSWPEVIEPVRFDPLPDTGVRGTLEHAGPTAPAPSTMRLLWLVLITALGGK